MSKPLIVTEAVSRDDVKHLADQIAAVLQGTDRSTAVASLLSIVMLLLDPDVTPEMLVKGIREVSQYMTLMLGGYKQQFGKEVVH